jgi:hypothetical protein
MHWLASTGLGLAAITGLVGSIVLAVRLVAWAWHDGDRK